MPQFLRMNKIQFYRYDNVHVPVKLSGESTFIVSINRLYVLKGQNLVSVERIGGFDLLYRVNGTRTYLVAFDILNIFHSTLRESVEDVPSTAFRVFAQLPISYRVIPKPAREYLLRRNAKRQKMPQYSRFCLIDGLAYLFLALLLISSKKVIPTLSFWKDNRKYAFAVTHDVESRNGFEKQSVNLRRIEERLDIKSSWNFPSHRYHIAQDGIRELVQKHRIGGHDTSHDGKLALLDRDKLVRRLTLCRTRISDLSGAQVTGFRAPLLQHSHNLLRSVYEAGFTYDSSCPTWEPVSSLSGKSHGIKTVFPLNLEGLTEIPVTLTQDHQLIYLLRTQPEKCVQYWLEQSNWIKQVGGIVLLLIHPEYSFSEPENSSLYRILLSTFALDKTCWITTTDDLAIWWRTRYESCANEKNGNYEVKTSGDSLKTGTLMIRLFTAYDDAKGFDSTPCEERISYVAS
jgi:hypothetical protein